MKVERSHFRNRSPLSRILIALAAVSFASAVAHAADDASPGFGREIVPILSKLGCNGGGCHGAVQGKNGFRLSLFGADPEKDLEQLAYGVAARRIDRVSPERSLFLLKATGQVPHEGGRLIEVGSFEYELLRKWVAAGSPMDEPERYQVKSLRVEPAEQVMEPGKTYSLRVTATFADGSVADVSKLCSYESRDKAVATVGRDGTVSAVGVGDTALVVRYRDEPTGATVLVPRVGGEPFPSISSNNFIDDHILAKLKRLNVPPALLADDATFLRRASLDITGALPKPEEVQAFVADKNPGKRAARIDELLGRPGHAGLWALKFCDLLKATDFGIYADGMKNEDDTPRFQAWVRARLAENTPYDQLAERILLATSREGRSVDEWAKDVEKLYELSTAEWGEADFYSQRKTLDLYWQRKNANGVPGTLQVAHAFLGLKLECAQCHRHPHDVWQQDDLLSFANFFMRVRTIGFKGENEKKYPDHAKAFKARDTEGKSLEAEVKKLKEDELKALVDKLAKADKAKKDNPAEYDKIKAEHDKLAERVKQMERRGRYLKEEVAKRILHTDIFWEADDKSFAKVTSPLGSQESKQFRLPGETAAIEIKAGEDPRRHVVEWMRRPDNPYFAKAIVNRVWAHYFGRGLIDPPDDLSPLNPATHPALLNELAKRFIEQKYDLRWLHKTILASRTYQQSSTPDAASLSDRSNYASFYFRRLPAEVLVDAVDHATGVKENLDMKSARWPQDLRMVESPFVPRNPYVTFMMEQFGRPKRNTAVQCDCERDPSPSVLQVMSLANHPRILQKIADPTGRAAAIAKEHKDADAQIDALFLAVLSRSPDEAEREACRKYLAGAASAEKGVQGVMWSLMNTREFVLQY